MKIFASVIFFYFSLSSAFSYDAGVSLSGTGIGYSTATKGYFSLGAVYEKPLGDHWSYGVGARSFFAEFVTIYGPQVIGRYFLSRFDEGGWHGTLAANYNFYNIKDDTYDCGCSRFGSNATIMYQWMFGNDSYFSFGIGSGLKTLRVFPSIDFGAKF